MKFRVNIEGWPQSHVRREIARLRAEGCTRIENVSGYFLAYERSAAAGEMTEPTPASMMRAIQTAPERAS